MYDRFTTFLGDAIGRFVQLGIGLLCLGTLFCILAFLWKPNLENAKDFVLANDIALGWEDDSKCEIYLEDRWFDNRFYLKTSDNLFYLGRGILWSFDIYKKPRKVNKTEQESRFNNGPKEDFKKCILINK